MRLLLLLLPLLPFMAKADMDKICLVSLVGTEDITYALEPIQIEDEIRNQRCERNNVLVVSGTPELFTQEMLIAYFCRFDRNVIKDNDEFTCVLYDKEPRIALVVK